MSIRVRVVNPSTGKVGFLANSMVSHQWAGAGTTNAPTATGWPDFVVGVNNGGAATANVYWTINGAWVSVGATVANLFGA